MPVLTTDLEDLYGTVATGVGIALSAATIVTPVWLAHLLDGAAAAAFPGASLPFLFDGLWTIQPGGFIGYGALTAVTGLGSMVWEEVPIV